jgi:hypothetical protein
MPYNLTRRAFLRLLVAGSIAGGASDNLPQGSNLESVVETSESQGIKEIRFLPFDRYVFPQTKEFSSELYEKQLLSNPFSITAQHTFGPLFYNYNTFRDKVLQDFQLIKYDTKRLSQLTPKEVTKATCELMAYKFDIAGTQAQKDFRRDLDELKTRLQDFIKRAEQEGMGPEVEQETKDLLRRANLLGAIIRPPDYFINIAEEHSNLSAQFIYEKVKEIICADYARLGCAIQNHIIAPINSHLKHSFLTVYIDYIDSKTSHAWNQLNTIIRGKEGLQMVTTFFDPLFFDHPDKGIINAYDSYHMGINGERLKNNVSEFLKTHNYNIKVSYAPLG